MPGVWLVVQAQLTVVRRRKSAWGPMRRKDCAVRSPASLVPVPEVKFLKSTPFCFVSPSQRILLAHRPVPASPAVGCGCFPIRCFPFLALPFLPPPSQFRPSFPVSYASAAFSIFLALVVFFYFLFSSRPPLLAIARHLFRHPPTCVRFSGNSSDEEELERDAGSDLKTIQKRFENDSKTI